MKIKIEQEALVMPCDCCWQFNTYLYVDGQLVNQDFNTEEEALGYVLKKYFKVEIEDDPFPASVRPFNEYGHYGENNPPLPFTPVGDKLYDT